MTDYNMTLAELGWSNFFQGQMTSEEFENTLPHRVTEVHRNAFDAISTVGTGRVDLTVDLGDQRVAVGDWVLVDTETGHPVRILDRKSEIKRRGAGEQPIAQLMAANIDTLFIVSSCNADYNTARLERYLALARQALVEPVLVLTKADMAEDADAYRARAEQEFRGVIVETVDATSSDVVNKLMPWCKTGQTVALVGSSGVGKTTLMNALAGQSVRTQDIREDDAKGRHTTTARSMYPMTHGGWLVDTPGIRALRLYDVADGVDMVFEDLADLAATCRFNDCQHDTEPGCAVQAAIADGVLDESRLKRWQKLRREDARNSESLAEQHARARGQERKYRSGREAARKKRDI